jgi:hypothetical protein
VALLVEEIEERLADLCRCHKKSVRQKTRDRSE